MSAYALTIPELTEIAIGGDAINGYLKTVKMCLFKGDVAVDPNTPFADFDTGKADYTGYTEAAITWSPITRADDGSIEYLGVCLPFRPTDSVKPNMVRGAYVKNMAGDNWVCAVRFPDQGIPMQSNMDSLALTLRYRPAAPSILEVIS